ncbi:MAG: GNAT family N-acetyltransferase [Pseudomonadota bacterium]
MSDLDRLEFIALVNEAGEVDPNTLPALVARALALVTLHDNKMLIGTAAVKIPYDEYRRDVFRSAKIADQANAYPLELGWVHVRPDYRGEGHSYTLMAQAIKAVAGQSVYATTKAAKMHTILPRYGFAIRGMPYASMHEPDVDVTLFCRSG